MKIRFGYVAMSVELKNASPSKTITVKSYSRLADRDPGAALDKVRRVASENLDNTMRLLRHNKASGVEVYRFSSKIMPLATHPLLSEWDYINDLSEKFLLIGNFVKKNNFRVTFHPDHYTLINSPREEVLRSSLIDLEHHCRILEAMGLSSRAKLVTHVGGGYGDKTGSMERFLINWRLVPSNITGRLSLENDDKTFTAVEVLSICKILSIPMVFDIHHFNCNNEGEKIEIILPLIFTTWEGSGLPPKVHISSPRSKEDFRSHHDFVNADDLYPFLKQARELNRDIDVMVEAKKKDLAMFKLVKELAGYPMITQKGNSTLLFN